MATISKKLQRRLAAEADRVRAREEKARKQEADQQAAHEEEITRLIAETGWAVCVADSDDPTDPGPHFGYTIGRSAQGQPELCAWGHDPLELQGTLNLLGRVAEKYTAPPVHGDMVAVPGVGVWEVLNVPDVVMGHLEYARRRYTFIRAVRMRRVA